MEDIAVYLYREIARPVQSERDAAPVYIGQDVVREGADTCLFNRCVCRDFHFYRTGKVEISQRGEFYVVGSFYLDGIRIYVFPFAFRCSYLDSEVLFHCNFFGCGSRIGDQFLSPAYCWIS